MFQRLKRGGWPYSQPPNVQFDVNKDSEQAEGLVAWWPTLASAGAGVLREFIYGSHATLLGTELIADAKWGTVLSSPTAGADYATYPVDTKTLPGALTITAWINMNANPEAAANGIIRLGSNAAATCLTTILTGGNNRLDFFRFGVADHFSDTNMPVQTWLHVAAVVDAADNYFLYLNGVPDGNGAFGAHEAHLGTGQICSYQAPNFCLNGLLFDLRVHEIAKSPAQVYRIATNPWELRRPRTRRVWAMAPAAPPAGAMPMAMDHYRRRRV